MLEKSGKGRNAGEKPVGFSVSYSDSDDSVSLTLAGKPTFTDGGELILNAAGITSPSGTALAGTTMFTILPRAKGISG